MVKTAKKTISNRERKRISIVALNKAGLSHSKIGKQCRVNRSTVNRVLKKYQSTHTTADMKRSGRPSKLTDRDRRQVVRILKKGEAKTAVGIQKKFQSKTGIKISTDTVSKTLKGAGYVFRIKRKKPLLTKSHIQLREKVLRLGFENRRGNIFFLITL
jgi:transposase